MSQQTGLESSQGAEPGHVPRIATCPAPARPGARVLACPRGSCQCSPPAPSKCPSPSPRRPGAGSAPGHRQLVLPPPLGPSAPCQRLGMRVRRMPSPAPPGPGVPRTCEDYQAAAGQCQALARWLRAGSPGGGEGGSGVQAPGPEAAPAPRSAGSCPFSTTARAGLGARGWRHRDPRPPARRTRHRGQVAKCPAAPPPSPSRPRSLQLARGRSVPAALPPPARCPGAGARSYPEPQPGAPRRASATPGTRAASAPACPRLPSPSGSSPAGPRNQERARRGGERGSRCREPRGIQRLLQDRALAPLIASRRCGAERRGAGGAGFREPAGRGHGTGRSRRAAGAGA